MFRSQVRDEIELLRGSWSLYRVESGALARALLIALSFSAVCTFLILPFFVRGGHASVLAETAVFVVIAALVLSPLSGGLVGMVLGRVREGRPGRARDVFLGYRHFLPLAVAGALSGCAFELRHTGSWHVGLPLRLLAIVVGFGVSLLLVYLVPTIVDQRLPLGSSLLTALRLLRPPELWRTMVAAVLILAVGLLLEQPLNLIARRSFGFASLYAVVVALLFGPFAITYAVGMYVRAADAQAGRSG